MALTVLAHLGIAYTIFGAAEMENVIAGEGRLNR
jgi:hypothetical protein